VKWLAGRINDDLSRPCVAVSVRDLQKSSHAYKSVRASEQQEHLAVVPLVVRDLRESRIFTQVRVAGSLFSARKVTSIMIEEIDAQNQPEAAQPEPTQTLLLDWQIAAVAELLAIEVKDLREQFTSYTKRYYLEPERYRGTVQHIVSIDRDNELVVDQIDTDEKYQNRVRFEGNEFSDLLAALLQHHLATKEPAPSGNSLPDDDDSYIIF
jgi:hypothetical protein